MLTRRTAILGALFTPVIIRTPGLLMPIKPVCPIILSEAEAMLQAMIEDIARIDGIARRYFREYDRRYSQNYKNGNLLGFAT